MNLGKRLLRIRPDEVFFAKRGFGDTDPAARDKLEHIGRVFLDGYALALDAPQSAALPAALERRFDPHHVGFAFEGAGFFYALLDLLAPKPLSRLREFTDAAASKHASITTVGAGFALARVPWGRYALARYLRKLDPAQAFWAADGYGFHQGFFHHRRFIEQHQAPPSRWPDYARRLFDAGLGRSLWWVAGADPDRIRPAVDPFDAPRRAELWCGVGLASAYAGGTDEKGLQTLAQRAGTHRVDLLSGAFFAASLRQDGENPSPWTELACRSVLGMTTHEASQRLAAVSALVASDGVEAGGERYLAVRRKLNRALSADH